MTKIATWNKFHVVFFLINNQIFEKCDIIEEIFVKGENYVRKY